jgi:hypothetical protein
MLTTTPLASPGARQCDGSVEPIRVTGDKPPMTTGRALTLALRLLCTTAATAAAVTLPGCCGIGFDPWQAAEAVELETDADLFAVTRVPYDSSDRPYENLAVGAGGIVVMWGSDFDSATNDFMTFVDSQQVGDQNLRAVWADESAWWVVGDAGTVVVSVDRGLAWTTVDLGTTANLRGITSVGSRLVVVGDGVVFLQGGDGVWTEIPAPAGGWGDLRAIHHDGSRVYVVGLAGKVWSAVEPSGEWMAEDVGTSVDLFDVGTLASYGDPSLTVVVGAAGTLLLRDTAGWTRVETKVDADLIAYRGHELLAVDGGLYEIRDNPKRRPRRIDTLAGALAMAQSAPGVLAVGSQGVAYDKPFVHCPGGRPFVVHGEPITAQLRPECFATSAMPAAIEPELARAWAEDGLFEHASVASFARFALELLALGAPPALLREVHVAIADELRHASLCFGLARRFGVAVDPGALPISNAVLARVGDPIATALALFEEGCVNESLAACEAADAAGTCQDAEIREVLESIAADERRHASLAWGALRWLIDTHGERVRAPLRARLARLESRSRVLVRDVAFDRRWIAHGRLSPVRRAQVHRRVMAELVSPLARELLVQPREIT